MSDLIKKLPAVFQTVAEKKFFDATFDQVFSKKDSEYLAGYLGKRVPGTFDPIHDFYIPEPTKNRTWWQLEPTAYSRDANYQKSNLFFYEDLLDKINFYGGNTGNQDRLFSSNYYSWAPPIDVDMFVNYHCYYWVNQGLPSVQLGGVLASDIIGQPSFTTHSNASPPGLTLTTGMVVSFRDDATYPQEYTVVFTSTGIQLIPRDPSTVLTSGTTYEFLPWDAAIEQNDGRIIDGSRWDVTTWEVQPRPGNVDYITIDRTSIDRNAWSRSNMWVHIDAILATCAVTGTAFPANAVRALRPIIQFIPNLVMYKSGIRFRANITYGFRNDDNGQLITLETLQSRPVSWIQGAYGVAIQNGDIVSFFDDPTQFTISNNPWDLDGSLEWDTTMWDDGPASVVRNYLFRATITSDDRVVFLPYTSWDTPVMDGDIVFVKKSGPGEMSDSRRSAKENESWYFESGQWQRVFSDKQTSNQPPLFMLYDHEGVELDNEAKYPDSTFVGSEIFAYKLDRAPGASLDPVLKLPIIYTSLGQSSDILFHNELITERHKFGDSQLPIDGYYYYRTSISHTLHNGWYLYCPDVPPGYMGESVPQVSKQRVVDRYVVGYGSEYSFKLSATPVGYPGNADIIVTVDGMEIDPYTTGTGGYGFTEVNGNIFVDLSRYITGRFTDKSTTPPVVEILTFTRGTISDHQSGYFQIPQQLDANPTQLEVSTISGSDLSHHFSSIIENQVGFSGVSFGGSNNYRDSAKNLSVGDRILQNIAPALKSMLVSSDPDLELIPALRFSQDEYTKFKNRYISTALRLINQGFSPIQYYNNSIVVNQWVDEILNVINVSKEFSNAFSYSYMVASGKVYSTETVQIQDRLVTLDNFVDLTKDQNAMYVYDVTGNERLLVNGHHYHIVDDSMIIEVEILDDSLVGRALSFVLYENPKPAFIPSTPAKLGLANPQMPDIVLDTSYASPTNVIIGHDGTRTVAYGDYRDQLLLELELRIYNLIKSRFRKEYPCPVNIQQVKPGYYRNTHYSYQEYLDVVEPHLNKWCAKNKANYRINEWADLSTGVDPSSLWKLYNYRHALTIEGTRLNLPGNWKGIFQYLYDTCYPDTRPWEMLGFRDCPDWWVTRYGQGVTNARGQIVWTANHASMWDDLEAGIIREGPSAIMDQHGNPAPNWMWARPGLRGRIPVDVHGEIIPIPRLFDLSMTTDPYHPYDDFDGSWQFGDGSPVEQAWMSTSSYAFSLQEIMYLMKPGVYGEVAWDTLGTQMSPGMVGESRSNVAYQYVQNDIYQSSDPFFKWMRPKNNTQVVHGELLDGEVNVRFGYQRWISDRIMYNNQDVTGVLGVKIRNLDTNLANKIGGFTNKDTVNLFMESVSIASNTSTMGVPSNNFEITLHKSPPIRRYAYSGVIIKSQGDGTFVIYGYDLLDSQFITLDRASHRLIDVTVGGTPADYEQFMPNETYRSGDIVKYNGIFYSSNSDQTPTKFIPAQWTKLNGLPIVGGISVTYKPLSSSTKTTYAYGAQLANPQEVFDFLIGWGAYLETEGWDFTTVDPDTNIANDWLSSAKQFLFWLNSDWAADSAIQLSPLAKGASLKVTRGYPNDVELISNGVYSILDKRGVAIPTARTITERDGQVISVAPVDLATGGVFFLQVTTSETEHALAVDNITIFNDIVYSPLLRTRQDRLRFNGFRSKGWYGKMEAPGYLIINDSLVPNYDTIVNDIRFHYDPNVILDDSNTEDLGRRLIGYESKAYMDSLQISDDIQYMFYKGIIRQKGTEQTLNKLFRSDQTRSRGLATVYEEWALKIADMGNTVGHVSTEFVLNLERDTGEVAIANLNYVPSKVGAVLKINVVDATTTYATPPSVVIGWPDMGMSSVTAFETSEVYYPDDVVSVTTVSGVTGTFICKVKTGPGVFDETSWARVRPAQAYAVLSSTGKIARVDMIDGGYGYTRSPTVKFQVNGVVGNDTAYAVWQGDVVQDIVLDNLVNIDIDDPETWVYRPNEPSLSATFPVTTDVDYSLPNAGYVSYADVDWYSFDVMNTVVSWGTEQFNPTTSETIWVAKTFNSDWDVFKMVDYGIQWSITNDSENGGLLLLVGEDSTIGTQYSGAVTSTDFGNLIVLQYRDQFDGQVPIETNYTLGLGSTRTIYSDANSVEYAAYQILTLDGVQVQDTDIPDFAKLNTLLFFKSLRYPGPPLVTHIPSYLGLGDFIWIDDLDGKWAVMSIWADYGIWDSAPWDQRVGIYWGTGTDGRGDNYFGWDTRGPIRLIKHRMQEPMIDTSMFDGVRIFPSPTGETVATLPVFDPFKGIIPGIVKQNLSYITDLDPARYNVTSEPRLRSDNIVFGENQVGRLWWDTSTAMYLYYEQPMAMDGSETPTDTVKYRRDNWARMFPGSMVDIYEWVESHVPPELYDGTGEPRDLSAYTAITRSDTFTNVLTTRYYFWVKGTTTKPNLANRTMTASEVATFLTSPRSQGYQFFAPIHQTTTSNAFMFYNVQDTLVNRGNYVRVDYRHSKVKDQDHAVWGLFREGDTSSAVTDHYWDKMVDSLCGFTSNQTPDANTVEVRGDHVYVVPDPNLSSIEKLGVTLRPRKSMFANIHKARGILVESLNALLSDIPVRDLDTKWSSDVAPSEFWSYVTWYKRGYEGATPQILFRTLTDAYQSLVAGHLNSGDIIQVIKGTVDGRAVMYEVQGATGSYQLDKVAIQNSSVILTDLVRTVVNDYGLSVTLRQILTALRGYIFSNEYSVYQNKLFASMLNFVVSEQRTPDWVFKTSFITIKESPSQLTQSPVFLPSQIDNIIAYITDVKPYHTQVRNYTSTYSVFDTAYGGAKDSLKTKLTLKFDPGHSVFDPDGWDTFAWDSYGWDKVHDETVDDRVIVEANTYSRKPCVGDDCSQVFGTSTGNVMWDQSYEPWDQFIWDGRGDGVVLDDDVSQFISHEPVFSTVVGGLDMGKRGMSQLFPYTFTFDELNKNNPQSFITPNNMVSISRGDDTLIYGRDYYVMHNSQDNTYTAFLFNDPGADRLVANVLVTGGDITRVTHPTSRKEYAFGYPTDGAVITVDTRLPVKGNGTTFGPAVSTSPDRPVVKAIIKAGGVAVAPEDGDVTSLDSAVISYRQVMTSGDRYYVRNATTSQFTLAEPVYSPNADGLWLDRIYVNMGDSRLPDPSNGPVALWLGGERIEYRQLDQVGGYWVLTLVRRGTKGTSAQYHPTSTPVFAEIGNTLPSDSHNQVWSADSWQVGADLSSGTGGQYQRVINPSEGGLWYSQTPQAGFLIDSPGQALN